MPAPAFNRRVRTSVVEVGIGLLIALVAIAIHWKILLDGSPVNSHALTGHVTWLHHFGKQFAEGDWYPRWLAGTNYGYGSPTFVFYPPLIYYLGAWLRLGGLTIDQIVAVLLVAASAASGFCFYWFGRMQWGWCAALGGALIYMANPYMIYNIYTRGSLSEIWALAWVPLGFGGTLQALQYSRWWVVSAIAFCLLALTHIPSLLLYTLCWAIYLAIWFGISRNRAILKVASHALLGLGLAAFFLLPAVTEKSLVDVKGGMQSVLGGFRANFIGTAMDYLYINPFMINVQTIFLLSSLVALAMGALALICWRQNAWRTREVYSWLGLILALAFLMSYWSAPIWQAIAILQALQFPWRFMGFYWFSIAALSGVALHGWSQDRRPSIKMAGWLLVLGILSFAVQNLYQQHTLSTLHRPGEIVLADHEKMRLQGGPASEQKLLQRVRIRDENRRQEMKVIFYQPFEDNLLDVSEYRPLLPGDRPVPLPQKGQPPVSVLRGQAIVRVESWRSNERQLQVSVQRPCTLRLRTYAFPAWQLRVNGTVVPLQQGEDGTIQLALESGTYHVELRYGLTPVLTIGIGISLLSLGLGSLLWLKGW